MIMYFICHFLLVASAISSASLLKISESGFEETPPFSTVISFFLVVKGDGVVNSTSVEPKQCCLYIETNDTDCQIMTLGNSKDITTETGIVTFTFRNLYARYRRGYCRFSVTKRTNTAESLTHIIPFNTYPPDYIKNCTGIDLDPERNCDPVDCAIKYKGFRNYFNSTRGKCEPVAKCNTRGSDGITIIAYYDWDSNECIQYKWFENDNYLNQVESDTEIPVNVDPSQTKYYPELEPELLENSTDSIGPIRLQCNHGVQTGQHCICDDGWISSGIHKDTPLVFHWCDQPIMIAAVVSHPPRKLTKSLEYFIIMVLCIVNVGLLVLWMFVSVKLFCPEVARGKKSKKN